MGLASEQDSDASDDNRNKPPELSPEERQAMALRNREEKQRKYEEVRERLFGSPSAPASGSSSRSATPPKQDGRGKGKSRGGRESRGKRDSPGSSGKKQLYEPGQSPKPSPKPSPVFLQRDDSRNSRSEGSWRGGGPKFGTRGARTVN